MVSPMPHKSKSTTPSEPGAQATGHSADECRMSNVECRLPDPTLPFDNRHSTIDDSDHSAVWKALESVTDPEIPVVNIVEMGIVAGVRMEADSVVIDMTPTFVGCPALDVIRENIRTAVSAVTPAQVRVIVVYDPPWTSERISENGRRKLKAFGLAPPGDRCSGGSVPTLERVACPYCDSRETNLESIFGPTLCRSIHYCRSCLQAFEHFKAV